MTGDNSSDRNRLDRRTVVKAIGGTSLAGLASMPGLVGGRSISTKDDPIALDPEDAEPTAPRVETATELKQATPQYHLLFLAEDSVRYYIDNSDRSPEEKRKAHENFTELKRTFPVRKKVDGNLTRYELAPGADKHPDKKGAEKFEQVDRVFGEGVANVGGGVSIQHHPKLHNDMTESSGVDMDLSSDVRYTTKEYADDPDDPTVDIGVPDVIPHDDYIESGIEDFLADVIHHVGQYFNPDPGWSYSYLCDHNSTYHDGSSDVNGIGGAPTATQYHFNKADNTSGETREQWVGRLTHFPQDMGQPLHTGMAWQQANLDIKYDYYDGYYVTIDPMYWLHYGYEDFVYDYWGNSYHEFHNAYDSNNCSSNYCFYETNGDGSYLVDQLASFSHQYSEKVYKTILEEDGTRDPSEWDFSTRDDLSQLTRDCLHETGLWVRGCLDRYFG